MNGHGLGHCLGCRYAHSQGQDVNPFVPATHLVMGVGLCWICAEAALSLFLNPQQLTNILNAKGRSPAP